MPYKTCWRCEGRGRYRASWWSPIAWPCLTCHGSGQEWVLTMYEPTGEAVSETAFLVPDRIVICARCGYRAWRDGYPCNRCGGLEPRVYVDSSESERLRAALETVRMALTMHTYSRSEDDILVAHRAAWEALASREQQT